MNKEQVKQELHKLINNLDFDKAKIGKRLFAAEYFSPNRAPCIIDQLFLLLEKAQLPKEKPAKQILTNEERVQNWIKITNELHYLIKGLPKPKKEKTLEQKLIDAGFEQSKSFSNIYSKNKINIWLAEHDGFVEASCGADILKCNLDNHDQILADIAYLECRIK